MFQKPSKLLRDSPFVKIKSPVVEDKPQGKFISRYFDYQSLNTKNTIDFKVKIRMVLII